MDMGLERKTKTGFGVG